MLAAPKYVENRNLLLERLEDARARTDELFAVVKTEALYDRPIPERHRIIFYLGHLEAFDWNLLHERILGIQSFHPEYDRLFAFGIDPVDGGLPTDQADDWPELGEVKEYVNKLRRTIDAGLEVALSQQGRNRNRFEFSPDQLLNVAIEHRLMHAETFAYMLHQLPLDRKVRKPSLRTLAEPASAPRMVEIPEGDATLGLARDGASFGWDNEFEKHVVHVPAFAIDEFEVTNGQYLDFMRPGGYDDRSLWSDADWKWKTDNNISHPAFWKQHGDHWHYLTMFDRVPLPMDWPVYVSHAEASAYARWAGKKLPSEAQWHRAAYGTPRGHEYLYPWGDHAPNSGHGNFDFQSWDPVPVSAYPDGRSAFGVADMLGNGWEWTSTPFQAFPGFEPFPFYLGYSANFFDGKHYVMKGGSPRTAACMLRASFRNWFQPHYQYVYAGFRCVND
jgi:gamma-glutamyl hercynylcysteine S-oxide synthase